MTSPNINVLDQLDVRIVVLKSGEHLITDMMQDEDYDVVMFRPFKIEIKRQTEKRNEQMVIVSRVELQPWIPYTDEQLMWIPGESVVTIVTANEAMTTQYYDLCEQLYGLTDEVPASKHTQDTIDRLTFLPEELSSHSVN